MNILEAFEKLNQSKIVNVIISTGVIKIRRGNYNYKYPNQINIYRTQRSTYRIGTTTKELTPELYSKLESIIEKEMMNND